MKIVKAIRNAISSRLTILKININDKNFKKNGVNITSNKILIRFAISDNIVLSIVLWYIFLLSLIDIALLYVIIYHIIISICFWQCYNN